MSTPDQSSVRAKLPHTFNRRQFLRMAAGFAIAAGVSACLPANPTAAPPESAPQRKKQQHEAFTPEPFTEPQIFEYAANKARYFDNAWQMLPERTFTVNEHTITDFLKDISRMFEYNTYRGMHADTPVAFEWYPDGLHHLRVLGRTDCEGEKISLNERFITPNSAWYNAIEAFSAAVHEEAHNKQGREQCNKETVEQSAQVVTWEMLAFAARGGNTTAAYALMRDMRHVFMDIALLHALKYKGGYNEYMELVDSVSWMPFDQSILHARTELLPKKLWYLRDILENYSQKPLSWIIGAQMNGTRNVTDLAYPAQYDFEYLLHSYPSGYEVASLPYPVDNIIEFMTHADTYAQDIRDQGYIRHINATDWCQDLLC